MRNSLGRLGRVHALDPHCVDGGSMRTAVLTPYSGPRPSPARVWTPWVLVTASLCGIGNLALLVLNLVERHYQQQRLAGHSPSVARIRDTLSLIHTLATLTLVASIAFLVVGVTWELKRRTRARVARDGETGVEPSLRSVSPTAFWTFWIAFGASFLANEHATSSTTLTPRSATSSVTVPISPSVTGSG